MKPSNITKFFLEQSIIDKHRNWIKKVSALQYDDMIKEMNSIKSPREAAEKSYFAKEAKYPIIESFLLEKSKELGWKNSLKIEVALSLKKSVSKNDILEKASQFFGGNVTLK
jgi:hypothetical protein